MVVLAGATSAGMLYYLFPSESEGPPEKVRAIYQFVFRPQDAFPNQDRLNLLCLGLDQNWTREDIPYTRNTRSDTMFVASLDLKTCKVNLLSLPRDLAVNIPGWRGKRRINSASALGGPELAVATVQEFLEVPIDHYIVLKIHATKRLVDALGGVDIEVEKDMDYDDNWGHLHIHLKKGWQHLNGEQAVGYIRFRHDREGDFGRIRRQQQMVQAILHAFRQPQNWLKLGRLLQVARDNIETDLTNQQILSLANLFRGIHTGDIRTATLPGESIRWGGASFLTCDENEKRRLVDSLLRGSPGIQTEEDTSKAEQSPSSASKKFNRRRMRVSSIARPSTP